jgi:membrane fusion protein, multidrug efflux system
MLQRSANQSPTMYSVRLLGGATTWSRALPELPVGPASTPRRIARRRRAVLLLVAAGLTVSLWWGSGYVVAYTDDAYVDSDVVQVTPQVAGPIEAVHVSDNQWVERGSILFTIDPTPFRLRVQQAIAREEQAKAQLPVDTAAIESLQAQKEAADEAARLAAINLGRVTPLTRDGFASKQTYDNTFTAQQQSVAQQRNAEATLKRAEQTLQLHQAAVATAHAARLYAEWQLNQTEVTAPVDGQITNLRLARGDYVSPSRAALAIVDASAWRVIANYKEYHLRHLPPGREVWVWLDSNPWHLYRARVQGIAHAISRDHHASTLVPYVSPTVDWIRLDRRIPVRLQLIDPPSPQSLFMGADARVFALY